MKDCVGGFANASRGLGANGVEDWDLSAFVVGQEDQISMQYSVEVESIRYVQGERA